MKKNNVLIAVLIVLIISTVVAFARLSTRLNINGQASIDAATWKIEFDNKSLTEVSNVGNLKPTVALSNTTFQLSVKLVKPLDSITYTFDVVNNGDIDATVTKVITPDINAFLANQLTYKFTYLNGDEIKEGDLLPVGSRKTLMIFIAYDDVDSLSSESIPLDLTSSILFKQA